MTPEGRRLLEWSRRRQNEIGATVAGLLQQLGESYLAGSLSQADFLAAFVAAEAAGHAGAVDAMEAFIREFRRAQTPGESHVEPVRDVFDGGASAGRALGLTEDLAKLDRADPQHDALARSLVSAMAARGHRHTLGGGRRTMKASADANGTRWRRIPGARPCAFCAMLATRGFLDAGYRSRESALWSGMGDAYHDHCTCTAAEIVGELTPTAAEQALIDLYQAAQEPGATPTAVMDRMRAMGGGILSDAAEVEEAIPDGRLSMSELEDRMQAAMDAGDYAAAERYGEILDSGFFTGTGAQVDVDDKFTEDAYDWFEEADPDTQARFLDSMGQQERDWFVEAQWEHISGRTVKKVPTAREARAQYETYLEVEYVKAESATNGFLLTHRARAAGRDPRDLWSVSEATARSWASPELLEYWNANPRFTWKDWQAMNKGDMGDMQKRAGSWQ